MPLLTLSRAEIALDLERALDAMIAQSQERFDLPDLYPLPARAERSWHALPGGFCRETLHLLTGPDADPRLAARLTRMRRVDESGSALWSETPELWLDASSEESADLALCQAMARALAPPPPSLLSRLFGHRARRTPAPTAGSGSPPMCRRAKLILAVDVMTAGFSEKIS